MSWKIAGPGWASMKSRAARGDWEPGSAAAPSRCNPSVRLQVQIGIDDFATSRSTRATRRSSEERIYINGRPDSKIPRIVCAARLSVLCGLLRSFLLLPLYKDAAGALFGEAGAWRFAPRLFGAAAGAKTPSPELEKLGDVALREAKKSKASYPDIRIVCLRDQLIGLRLTPERGTGKIPASGSALACSSIETGALRHPLS